MSGGLYVHIPYCHTKCGYCDFYSVPMAGRPSDDTVDMIMRELRWRTSRADCNIETVFLGGGTPTVLELDQFDRLLDTLDQCLEADAVVEFTCEANPATIDGRKAERMRASGITRVSLGAQSFHPHELAFLERLHDPADIPASVAVLKDAGFGDFNLDLIFGIGGQTLASWRESLQRALDLEPTHLACYGLTYEPGTALTRRLSRGLVQPCDENVEAQMYVAMIEMLADAGFEHYEVSNFSRPGHRCLHNINYWSNGPYMGVGPSAVGYVDGVRYRNAPNIDAYVRRMESDGHAVIEQERIETDALAIETLMLQMRLIEGVDLDVFYRRTGVDLRSRAAGAIGMLIEQGLIAADDRRLKLTTSGLLVADAVIAELAASLESSPAMSLPVIRT